MRHDSHVQLAYGSERHLTRKRGGKSSLYGGISELEASATMRSTIEGDCSTARPSTKNVALTPHAFCSSLTAKTSEAQWAIEMTYAPRHSGGISATTWKVSSTSCTRSEHGRAAGSSGRFEASSPSSHSTFLASSHSRYEPRPRWAVIASRASAWRSDYCVYGLLPAWKCATELDDDDGAAGDDAGDDAAATTNSSSAASGDDADDDADDARSALDDGLIEHDGGDDVAADGGGSSAPPDGGGGDTPAPPSGSVGGREASSAKSTKQQHHKAEVAAEQQGHVESSNSTS